MMSGTGDGLVRTTEIVAQHIPRLTVLLYGRTCVIEGGSFYTNYHNPEGLAREIMSFLKDPGV